MKPSIALQCMLSIWCLNFTECVPVVPIYLQAMSEKMDSYTAQDWAFDVLDVDQTCRVSRWGLTGPVHA